MMVTYTFGVILWNTVGKKKSYLLLCYHRHNIIPSELGTIFQFSSIHDLIFAL